MTVLVIAFVLMLLLTFGMLAFLTRPTEVEKAVEKRLTGIGSAMSSRNPSLENWRLFKEESRSSLTGLGQYLGRFSAARRMQGIIRRAESSMTLEAFLLITLGAGTAGFALSYYLFPVLPLSLAVMVLCGGMPYGYFSFKASRRLAKFNAELPNAADMMSRALRAGHSVLGAIEIIAEQTAEPCASEFREVFQQQNFGLPLRDSLLQLLERMPSLDLRVLVTAMLVQKETGGNLAEILDRTVHVIRERIRIHGEIRTQTAQGRLTGWILCLLPVVMLVLINLIDPGYSSLLLKDPVGIKLAYAGLVLMAIGALVIRKIINSIEV